MFGKDLEVWSYCRRNVPGDGLWGLKCLLPSPGCFLFPASGSGCKLSVAASVSCLSVYFPVFPTHGGNGPLSSGTISPSIPFLPKLLWSCFYRSHTQVPDIMISPAFSSPQPYVSTLPHNPHVFKFVASVSLLVVMYIALTYIYLNWVSTWLWIRIFQNILEKILKEKYWAPSQTLGQNFSGEHWFWYQTNRPSHCSLTSRMRHCWRGWRTDRVSLLCGSTVKQHSPDSKDRASQRKTVPKLSIVCETLIFMIKTGAIANILWNQTKVQGFPLISIPYQSSCFKLNSVSSASHYQPAVTRELRYVKEGVRSAEPTMETFSNKHPEDEKNKPVLASFPIAAIKYLWTKTR